MADLQKPLLGRKDEIVSLIISLSFTLKKQFFSHVTGG